MGIFICLWSLGFWACVISIIICLYQDYKNPNQNYPENEMSSEEWIREQRNKMKRKYVDGLTLREYILKRDNYTCQKCGNSIQKEPNLLLEVDHIYPVSKGGMSTPSNLETLCWKCNRSKSNKY